MRRGEAVDVGEIVRRVHWRAWDPAAEAPEVSMVEVVVALPVLIESGSAGVVWPRVRDVVGADHPAGMALEAAARAQATHNARAERELARVVGRLREAGIEPVLIKGLAVARLYPSPLVRPAGDLDLVVRDEDYAAAMEALAGWRLSFHGDRVASLQANRGTARADLTGNVDLHRFSSWYGGGSRAFFDRTERVEIGRLPIEVPGIEDHLRALCLHFLRHGAVRPGRLVDIALLADSTGMDWELVLRGSRSQVEQIEVAIRLAEALLGARMADAPAPPLLDPLPGWIAPTVLSIWGRPLPRQRTALREMAAHPGELARTMRRRWPDPLSATVRVRAQFDEGVRWPIQVFALGKQAGLSAIRTITGHLLGR
jgi:hypothetical protein